MRIGVLGGSFNPPHVGHLIAASDAHETLGLDRLLVVPANANPLKGAELSEATPSQRLDMVRLAFGGDTRFEVSTIEMERGGLSYTVDTLEALTLLHPAAELTLLLGADSFRTMDSWKRPERILALAHLAVLTRSEEDEVAGPGVKAVTTRRVDVSASEIRARVAAGRSIRGFVAESVERYIFAAELYRGPTTR